MAIFGKKKKKAGAKAAPKARARRAAPRAAAPRAAVRRPARQARAAPAQRAAPQNGLFITADGKIYLFHRTMGYKLMRKAHLDAAVKAAFGSK